MKGYKAFGENLKCRDFQYEIGKTYSIDEEPVLCKIGFHFCKTIPDCYNFYPLHESTRICEVEASGDIKEGLGGGKFVTNKITIIREITDPDKVKCNLGRDNIGYFNVGDRNLGKYNTGNENRGVCNTGHQNNGSENTGDNNTGCNNTGNYNSGSYNSGYYNYGNYNAGVGNIGNHNVGDFNFGDWNAGCFCLYSDQKIQLFDEETDWTIYIWRNSPAYKILSGVLLSLVKHNQNQYDKDIRQKLWDDLPIVERFIVYFLPNFDMNKFELCTGLHVNAEEYRIFLENKDSKSMSDVQEAFNIGYVEYLKDRM